MTGRSKDNWRGQRQSKKASQAKAATEKSWKRSKRPGAASSNRRPLGKIIATILLMLGVVVFGAMLFMPGDEVHTHFVSLDLLRVPATKAAGSEFFDPAGVPEPPELPQTNWPAGIITSSRSATLGFKNEVSTELNDADVIVVYLQTQFVTAAGEVRCLKKSSTPDLDDTQTEALQDLKTELATLTEADKDVLLIVEEIEGLTSWRLGDFQVDALTEVAQWPNAPEFKNRLVVIAASSKRQSYVATHGATNGKTTFGSIIARGWSAIAASESSPRKTAGIKVAEFCEFVLKESRQYGFSTGSEGNTDVCVSPTPDTIRENGNDFTVVGEAPDAPPFAKPALASGNNKLNQLWQQREELNQTFAWRWSPTQWQRSTELLLRAQQATLSGQEELAQKLRNTAEEALSELRSVTQKVVPNVDQLDGENGMPNQWFKDLPNTTTEGQSSAVPETVATFALQRNLQDYPFEKLGIDRSDSLKQRAIDCRKAAEIAAGDLMSTAEIIPNTVRSAEQQTLLAEDQLFTSNDQETFAESISANRSRWEAIRKFSLAHQRAELLVQQTVSASEPLAKWAATFPFDLNADFRNEWDNLLKESLSPRATTSGDFDTEKVDRSAFVPEGALRVAVPLRSNIFRLLASARALRKQLYPAETRSGFSTDELNSKADSLSDVSDLWSTEWKSVGQGFKKLSSRQHLVQPNQDVDLALQAQRIQTTLNVTSLSANDRQRLTTQLVELNEKLCDRNNDVASSVTTAKTVAGSDHQAAMWYAQHLLLFAEASSADTEASQTRKAILQLVEAPKPDRSVLGRFGFAVRNFWRQSRSTRTKTETGLRKAEHLRRGYSAFDLVSLSPKDHQQPATDRLHALWQANYCLSQADRLIQGQWALPQDQRPLAENGWYARTSDLWLDEARSLKNDRDLQFIDEHLAATEDAQKTAGRWTVRVDSSAEQQVDLSQDSVADAPVQFDLNYESSPASGIAALQLETNDQALFVTAKNNARAVDFELKPRSTAVTLHRDGIPGADGCQSLTFRPTLFFRGRRFSSPTSITADPCESARFLVRRTARPDTASVTVSGSELRPLAFVLDMSGSMEELIGQEPRYKVALDRLAATVTTRDENRRASLRVFGHRRGFDKQGGIVSNPGYEAAFGKQPPKLNPNRDSALEVPQVTLSTRNKGQFKNFVSKLEKCGPFGTTPLMLSLQEAIEDDLNGKPGVVIAITDGLASDAGIDVNNPAKKGNARDLSGALANVIQKHPTTKVIVVALNFQDPARRSVLTEIMGKAGIEEKQIVDAKDGDELDKKLREALAPIPYVVSSESDRKSAEFGSTMTDLQPTLRYKVEFASIVPAESLVPGPGDQLKLKVNWRDRRFEFEKPDGGKYGSSDSRPDDKQTPWVLRNTDARQICPVGFQPGDMGELDIILTLDNERAGGGRGQHPIKQPAEIEFRFTSPDRYRAGEIQENYFSDSGAPGYRFRIPEWPVDQSIVVDAAWKMKRTTAEHILAYTDLQQTKSLPSFGAFPECKLETKLTGTGDLDVSLTPIGPVPDRLSSPQSENLVEDIRVEIGSRGLLQDNSSFIPIEVTTAVYRTENGTVTYRFEGDFTPDSLRNKEIAFTSRNARLKNAIRIQSMDIERSRETKTSP